MFTLVHYKNFLSTLVDFKIPESKQAWRSGIVCVVYLYANEKWLKTEFPGWVLVTAVVCLQANFGATLRRAKQRLLGTILGCALAFAMAFLFPGNISLSVIILLGSTFFAVYNSVYSLYSYTYTVFFLTFGLISTYSTIFPDGEQFALLRIEDVALGALFGTLGSLLLWPDFARKTFRNNLLEVVSEIENLFQDIIDWVDEKIKDEKVYEQKVLSATNNQNARTKIIEIYHELGQSNYPLKEYEAFILSQERIHYSLLTIYNSLRINSFEKRKESIFYVVEQLTSIQNYFRVCVARLPLTKEKAHELLQHGEDLELFEKLENKAMQFLYQTQGKTVSFDMIKHRSLLERLLQEVKSMNAEINSILKYYTR